MGTKNDPGRFDCYKAAGPDEPMFVLLARDPTAPSLVRAWAALRVGDMEGAQLYMEEAAAALAGSGKPLLNTNDEKFTEAAACAADMVIWREEHRPSGTSPPAPRTPPAPPTSTPSPPAP